MFHLIPQAKDLWLKFWSVRIALSWGALSGLITIWAAFQDVMPLWAFALASVLMNAAIAIARVTHQPGIGDSNAD